MKYIRVCVQILCFFSVILLACTKEAVYSATTTSSKHISVPQSIGSFSNRISKPTTQFKVVGYLTPWEGDITQLDYTTLTHINYAFAIPTLKGGLNPIDSVTRLQALVALAHQKNVKVILSIGGYNNGDDSGFVSLSANAAYRTNFVNTVLSTLRQYNLDGADIDWETPNTTTQSNYTLLINQLAVALHGQSKSLSIAAGPNNAPYIEPAVLTAIDFMNIMAYDSFDNPNHSTYDLAVNALAYWKGRGLPVQKAILGVPFYGRTSKNWTFTSYVNYSDILSKGGSPYEDFNGNLGYNGINTMQKKTLLALTQAGGIMIWELGADATGQYSLMTAIHTVIETKANSLKAVAPVKY